MRVPLTGGAYSARNVIANAMRCVNLFPEANPEESSPPTPVTHYQSPGLKKLAQVATAPHLTGRGCYQASNGNVYVCFGVTLYQVTAGWALTTLGTLTAPLTTPVSMADNGTTLVLVDGTEGGYTVDLATGAFAAIVDPAFYGADFVWEDDTFLIFNRPGTNQFYTTLSAQVTPFDPTYIDTKAAYPDLLATFGVVHNEIWLIGSQKGEVWQDSGGTTFPFSRIPGVYVEHGCGAKYSLAQADLSLFWLGADKQGKGIAFRGSAYKCLRISNHAVENIWSKYPTIADAIGFTYQMGGHLFYEVNFPSANATWIFDDATQQWHERQSAGANGLGRHRLANCVPAFGTLIGQDWENGKLYEVRSDVYTEDGVAIPRIRSFPHLLKELDRITHNAFSADITAGAFAGAKDARGVEIPPMLSLRWSDDRGKTWGTPVPQDMGDLGQFLSNPNWNRLGQARDRVYELSWQGDGDVALNGAFVDTEEDDG